MAPSLPTIGVDLHHRARLLVAAALAGMILVVGGCGSSADDGAFPPLQASISPSVPTATVTSAASTTSTDPGATPATGGGGETAGQSDQGETGPARTATTGPAPADEDSPDRERAMADPTSPVPEWLGRRTLPTTADGRVVTPQTTPEELRNRRLPSPEHLPAPEGPVFAATVSPVSPEVLARSTWGPECPVPPEGLAHLTMTFWGFDQRAHTGEMIVNRDVADDIVGVFDRLFQARFPIEEMRITTAADLDAPPTGDGNVTTAFVCRAVTGGSRFSEHAYGLAVDVNPFHNPYRRGDLVLPELAAHYLDRSLDQPGMIVAGGPVVEAFADIGWGWGGNWSSLDDYHHFSLNNR